MRTALRNADRALCALLLALLCLFQLTASTQAANSAQSSDQTDVLLADAKNLFSQSKFAEADRAVRRFLESYPNSADGHFLLGHILFREIQAEAILDRQLALQAQGGMGGRIETPEPPLPKDREEKAKASLEEFTAGAKYRDPSAADLKIVAFDYIVLGAYPDADKWLTKMLEWAPNDSDGWYNLGRTKYNENRFAEAISAFQQCLKLDPKNVKAKDNLGLSFAGMGRNEEAAAAYQQAIAWQEQSLAKSPRPYIDFGSLLIDENRPKDAVTVLLQAIEIDSRDTKTHELLGKAYTRLEDFPKAQAELEKAVELSPQTPNLHCMLAPVYRKRGLADKAKTEYESCAALTGSRSTPQTP